VKTSLGIWAFGPMVTRFVPGGYQPEHAGESTAVKVSRAVAGLGDLIDDNEFHDPQELDEENLEEVRAALDGHGIYAIATGTHLNPLFGKGALSSPNDSVRDAALAEALHAADFAGSVGAQMILWPGVEGYNYPFQTPYPQAWARFIDGVGEVASRCSELGIALFLEHKNSEPAM
jgi:xylose isomerase